jgi:hypothetical protein
LKGSTEEEQFHSTKAAPTAKAKSRKPVAV